LIRRIDKEARDGKIMTQRVLKAEWLKIILVSLSIVMLYLIGQTVAAQPSGDPVARFDWTM
jgi:hypothetical protein